jgi:hypothetical protein
VQKEDGDFPRQIVPFYVDECDRIMVPVEDKERKESIPYVNYYNSTFTRRLKFWQKF